MSKKYRKHGYAERLKYMHMLENDTVPKSVSEIEG